MIIYGYSYIYIYSYSILDKERFGATKSFPTTYRFLCMFFNGDGFSSAMIAILHEMTKYLRNRSSAKRFLNHHYVPHALQPLWAETLGPVIAFFRKRHQRQRAAMGLKKNENDGPICAMDDAFSVH